MENHRRKKRLSHFTRFKQFFIFIAENLHKQDYSRVHQGDLISKTVPCRAKQQQRKHFIYTNVGHSLARRGICIQSVYSNSGIRRD